MINSRLDLPKIIKPDGVCVELGVARGYYSDIILKNSKLKRLYSVDRWSDIHHNDQECLLAQKLLAKHLSRSTVMRMIFEQALEHFEEDGTIFDFIYVDAYAHTGQENGKILTEWYPKLKSGGIMSGHDYCSKYPQTIKAVDEFCGQLGVKPIIIPGDFETINPQDEYESWYFIKP